MCFYMGVYWRCFLADFSQLVPWTALHDPLQILACPQQLLPAVHWIPCAEMLGVKSCQHCDGIRTQPSRRVHDTSMAPEQELAVTNSDHQRPWVPSAPGCTGTAQLGPAQLSPARPSSVRLCHGPVRGGRAGTARVGSRHDGQNCAWLREFPEQCPSCRTGKLGPLKLAGTAFTSRLLRGRDIPLLGTMLNASAAAVPWQCLCRQSLLCLLPCPERRFAPRRRLVPGGHEVSALPRRAARGCLGLLAPSCSGQPCPSLPLGSFGFACQNPVCCLDPTLWMFSHYRQYFAPQTFLKFVRMLSTCFSKTPGFLMGAFNQNKPSAWAGETTP